MTLTTGAESEKLNLILAKLEKRGFKVTQLKSKILIEDFPITLWLKTNLSIFFVKSIELTLERERISFKLHWNLPFTLFVGLCAIVLIGYAYKEGILLNHFVPIAFLFALLGVLIYWTLKSTIRREIRAASFD